METVRAILRGSHTFGEFHRLVHLDQKHLKMNQSDSALDARKYSVEYNKSIQ